MAGISFERLVGIIMVVVVVFSIIWAFSGPLYAVVKPVLDWNVTLSDEEMSANENKITFNNIYNHYSQCRDSKKTDCKCVDEGSIILLDNSEVFIGYEDDGIRMYVTKDQEVPDMRRLAGVEYCYIYDNEGYEDTKNKNVVQINTGFVKLYTERDGSLVNSNNRPLGKFANPLVLLKVSKNQKIYLCIVNDEIAGKMSEESCY